MLPLQLQRYMTDVLLNNGHIGDDDSDTSSTDTLGSLEEPNNNRLSSQKPSLGTIFEDNEAFEDSLDIPVEFVDARSRRASPIVVSQRGCLLWLKCEL